MSNGVALRSYLQLSPVTACFISSITCKTFSQNLWIMDSSDFKHSLLSVHWSQRHKVHLKPFRGEMANVRMKLVVENWENKASVFLHITSRGREAGPELLSATVWLTLWGKRWQERRKTVLLQTQKPPTRSSSSLLPCRPLLWLHLEQESRKLQSYNLPSATAKINQSMYLMHQARNEPIHSENACNRIYMCV